MAPTQLWRPAKEIYCENDKLKNSLLRLLKLSQVWYWLPDMHLWHLFIMEAIRTALQDKSVENVQSRTIKPCLDWGSLEWMKFGGTIF